MKERLKKIISTLKAGKGYEKVMPKDNGDGTTSFGYAQYDSSIFDFFATIPHDYSYVDNIKRIEIREISTYTIKDIYTYITYIERGERFCTGYVSGFIDNGFLLALCERLEELLYKGKESMLNQFVNKKCDILVSFGSSGIDRGASPTYYSGTVLSVNEEFVAIDVESISEPNHIKKAKSTAYAGYTLIAKQYIISIRELTE